MTILAPQKKPSLGLKWYWWVLISLFFGLAAGGVLYGVLTHKEAGLLTVCWTPDGAAVYDNKECTRELKWAKQHLPLIYYVDFGVDHKDYVKSVTAGADMWNKEIGTQLLKRTNNAQEATVLVTWGSIKATVGGHASHKGSIDEGPTGATLTLVMPSDVHAVYRYAAHEWGHVLGLAHDEAPRSIMYPIQPGMTDEMKFVLPSDFDKKLLRELYK